MKILIIDPHNQGERLFQQDAQQSEDCILFSRGILETVWMLGTEQPQIVLVLQSPEPDLDWAKLSRSNCPGARVIRLPPSVPETRDGLQAFWHSLRLSFLSTNVAMS